MPTFVSNFAWNLKSYFLGKRRKDISKRRVLVFFYSLCKLLWSGQRFSINRVSCLIVDFSSLCKNWWLLRVTFSTLEEKIIWAWVNVRTFGYVRPTKTQISLRIRAVWSESSLPAWRNFASLLSKMRQVKIMIRLRECAGWSESLLGTQVRCGYRRIFLSCPPK